LPGGKIEVSNSNKDLDLLRQILENINKPEQLDNHPWVKSRMVADMCERNPALKSQPPGKQLIYTVSELFRKLMPIVPPRHGIRLDSRWGEFGILAAQYFGPVLFDLAYPPTLKEAWQSIDKAILLFVFNKDAAISKEDRDRYQLIGNEPEVAPNSTISDWHRKGLERMARFINQHNLHLEFNEKTNGHSRKVSDRIITFFRKIKPSRKLTLWFKTVAIGVLVLLLFVGLWKGVETYRGVKNIQSQATSLLAFAKSFSDLNKVSEASQRISLLRSSLASFQKDLAPILNITPHLGWIPVLGGDISQASTLIDMAVQSITAVDEVLQAITPITQTNSVSGSSLDILTSLSQLKNSDAQLFAAQAAFANAQIARQKLQTDRLSDGIKSLIIEKIDPILFSLESAFPVSDVLQMARLSPRLLGAAGNGPQEYMVLIQNEDELRPTGGFLTAVGIMSIENGKLIDLSFESTDRIDDLNKAYPKAPWQLDEYMKAEILLFRDSNWFTNFPTTVEWAKFLYSYTGSKSIDGVIAIDQHVVQELLRIMGPINVPGVDIPISADNILEYMRTAKQQKPPAGSGISWKEWDRKQFISWLADPLINKLLNNFSKNWQSLSKSLIQLLDEKHILFQFNDPEMTSLLAKRRWDGAVRVEPNSDFLMVVDSNIGFNKTNILLKSEYDYLINLADLQHPTANLSVTQTNKTPIKSDSNTECIQAGGEERKLPLDQRKYIIEDCYWNYLRIYTPAGSQLISSTPHEIPQKWPLREKNIPPHTDILDEDISGINTFGTLIVVPRSATLKYNYSYTLPPFIVSTGLDGKTFSYRLKIQKQPGATSISLSLHLILPPGMAAIDPPPTLQQSTKSPNEWVMETKIDQDLTFTFSFG
jgi:hypothetical protein